MMTPARRKREEAKAAEAQRQIDEDKYVGFSVACNNDEPDACHSLAEWFSVLRGDYAKSAGLYSTNCWERGFANSCYNLGILWGVGKGVERRDRAKALTLFERGCDLGNGDSCDMAGRTLLEEGEESDGAGGPGGLSRKERAMGHLRRGCDRLEHAKACNFLGEVLLLGRFGLPVDKGGARERLETACERFEMTACRNLMIMHRRGDGVPKDLAKAEEYRLKAIEVAKHVSGRV